MNIFENFDYDEYHELLNMAIDHDVHVVHDMNLRGGFTFAWQRDTPFAKGRMVKVAVTFCSPRDQFARKIGTYNALKNFGEGKFILLPVGSEDSAVIVERLRSTFEIASSHLYW